MCSSDEFSSNFNEVVRIKRLTSFPNFLPLVYQIHYNYNINFVDLQENFPKPLCLMRRFIPMPKGRGFLGEIGKKRACVFSRLFLYGLETATRASASLQISLFVLWVFQSDEGVCILANVSCPVLHLVEVTHLCALVDEELNLVRR